MYLVSVIFFSWIYCKNIYLYSKHNRFGGRVYLDYYVSNIFNLVIFSIEPYV